jgi:hypothetical protein
MRSPFFLQRHALGAGANRHALALEDRADLLRDVVVLARQQLRRISTTVTCEPKRRYICANSRPM